MDVQIIITIITIWLIFGYHYNTGYVNIVDNVC